jgi:hypothetical protein
MLHKPVWKDKTFFEMGFSEVTFNDSNFYVFYTEHLIDDTYMLQFQPRLLHKGVVLVHDYYEKEGSVRQFSEKQV